MATIEGLMSSLTIDTKSLDKAKESVASFAQATVSGMGLATFAVKTLEKAFGALAIAKTIKGSISAAKEYQSALIDMGRVTKVPFEELDRRIKSMPAILGNATQLMHGYYQVISAGVTDPAKAQEVLTDAAKLSKIAHMDQAETVRALTKVMQGYDGQIRSTAEAADLLITIERWGQTTVGELVPVIGEMANMSRLAAVSQYEMGGGLALVTQTAGSTAKAVTQLRTLIKSIIKPTKAMSDAFASIGTTPVEYVKQHGFVGFLKKMQELGKTDSGVSKLIGGRQEGVMAYAALQAQSFERLEYMIDRMQEKAGAFARAWEQYIKGLSANWDAFKNNVYNFMKDMGMTLVPGLTEGLNLINDNFRAIFNTIKLIVEYWAAKKVGTLLILAGGALTKRFSGGLVKGILGDLAAKIPSKKMLVSSAAIAGLGSETRYLNAATGKGMSLSSESVEALTYVAATKKMSTLSDVTLKSSAVFRTFKGAIGAVIAALSGPAGLGLAILGIIELEKSFDRSFKSMQDEALKTASALGDKGLGKEIEEIRKRYNKDTYEEAEWREKSLKGWADAKALAATEALAAKWKKVADAVGGYRDQLKDLEPMTKRAALDKIDDWYFSQARALGLTTEQLKLQVPELQKIYDIQRENILGPTPIKATGEAIKSVLNSFASYSEFASLAINKLGLSKEKTGEMFKEGLLGIATGAGDALADQFGNPYMKQIFGSVMENLGKHGGNALLEELGKTLRGAEDKMETFRNKMDAYKTELAKYEEARRSLNEKLVAGEAQQLVFGRDVSGFVEKIGMKYGEAPERGSFEEFFNTPIWGAYQEIKAPVAPVEPKDTLENATLEMMKGLQNGINNIDVENILKPIEEAMTNLAPVGEEAGSATGTALGSKLEEGALSAIERIRLAIASLPKSVDLSGVISSSLAKELEKMGRE